MRLADSLTCEMLTRRLLGKSSWAGWGLPLLLYVALALAWTLPVGVAHGALLGLGLNDQVGDPIQKAWSVAWIPFALGHGLNPAYTSYLHAPVGINYLWPPPDILYNLAVWPITAAWGVARGFDAEIALGIVTSAFCFYLLARRWTRNAWLATLAGAMFGFSPYIASEVVMGHSYLVEVAAIPLLAIAVDEILIQQRWRARSSGILLGTAATIQAVTSEELLFDCVIIGVLAILVLLLLNGRPSRERIHYVGRCTVWALPFTSILLALIGYQFFGPGALHEYSFPAALWDASPVSFILPGAQQLISTSASSHLVEWSVWGLPEVSTYLGLPMLVALLIGLWRMRDRTTAFLGIMLAVSMIIAMGFSSAWPGAST